MVVQLRLTYTVFVQKVLKIPDLLPHLVRLSNKGMALGPLLAWLVPHLGAGILDKKSWMECAIQMAMRLPLGKPIQGCQSMVSRTVPSLSCLLVPTDIKLVF